MIFFSSLNEKCLDIHHKILDKNGLNFANFNENSNLDIIKYSF